VFAVAGLTLGLALVAVSPWVVGFVSKGAISLDAWLLGGFVLFVVVQAAKYPIGMYMTDPAGLRFQVVPTFAMVVLNVALSWWLVQVIGAAGTIISSAVTVGLVQVVPNVWYVRRDLARRRTELAALRTS
jgi:hypothetical protein